MIEPSPSLAKPHATRIAVRGPDSVLAALKMACGELSLDVSDRGDELLWIANRFCVGPLAFMPDASVGKAKVRFHPSDYFVCLARGRGGQKIAHGRDAHLERASLGVVCSAGISFDWTSGGAHEGVSVRIDAHFLHQQLEALTGKTAHHPIEFSFLMRTEAGIGAAIERLCLFLAGEAERGVLFEHPMLQTTLSETFVRALLVGQPHNYSPSIERRTPRSSLRVVRMVEEVADAFASEPLPLPALVSLTGESGLAMNAAFRAYRGMGLGQALAARRLDVANREGPPPARGLNQRSSRRRPSPAAAPAIEPAVMVMGTSTDKASQLAAAVRRAGHEATELDSMEALLAAALAGRVLCVIADVRGAEGLGPALVAALAEVSCPLPVVLLGDVGDGRAVVEAMKAGAMDYLFAPEGDGALAEALERAVAEGRLVRAWITERRLLDMKMQALTGREREVCERVARGMLNKQIAADLGISEARVKVHRANGMEKLGVSSAAELGRLFEANEGQAR